MYFSARRPVAKWTINGENYYVDSAGKAFLINYFDEPELSIVDENHFDVQPGETPIASNRFLEFIGRLVSDMALNDLEIDQITIPLRKLREVDIKVKGRSYPFKLSIDRSPAEQAEDIKRLIKHLDDNKIRPRYVDIRVKGRAYYR